MREAELKRQEAVGGNGRLFFFGMAGAILVFALLYFLTQYVVKDGEGFYRNKEFPINRSLPADDRSNDNTGAASHPGGAIMVAPGTFGFQPTVYFS
jgi:hypothetical protein